MSTFDLRSIITEEFQNEIQDSFAYATGFGVVFTDAEGNHIGPGGNFCRFCNKINETPEGAHYCSLSNKHAIELALAAKRPSIYICHAGLVNIEIPLIYENQCVGAITAGQVLCNEDNIYPQDEIASEINWLADPQLASFYSEIEVMDRHRIEATTTALSNLTNYVIQKLAYSQIQEQLAKQSEALIKAEHQLKIAQLDALQKQVTPHFIFNVINSISRLLSLKEYDTAEQMLTSFAQMLRYTLSNMKMSVLLEEELDYIQNYLTIQKMRFGDCIDYQIECDKEIQSLKIPFFSIQPLIENSIKHGLLSNQKGGTVSLRCKKHGDCVTITVEDTGSGIAQDQLQFIRSTLLSPEPTQDEHVGLQNCYRRFLLMFEENFHFSIESTVNCSTTVTITLSHPIP